jgi:uncharacterized protein DUF732
MAAIVTPAPATAAPDCPVGTVTDDDGSCFPSGPPGSAQAELANLHMLEERGINPGNPDGAAADGRVICNSINAGNNFSTVQLNAMRWTNLPYRQAATVVVKAIIFIAQTSTTAFSTDFRTPKKGTESEGSTTSA